MAVRVAVSVTPSLQPRSKTPPPGPPSVSFSCTCAEHRRHGRGDENAAGHREKGRVAVGGVADVPGEEHVALV
jgi:hypothetical protein